MINRGENQGDLNLSRADAVYSPYGAEELVFPYPVPRNISKELNSLQEDLNTYVSEKQASWIFGKTDIDDEWDEYLKELEKMKIERVVEIYQELRDDYFNKLGDN